MQIVNPKSKSRIDIDGPTYNKLIKSGDYSKKYLDALPKYKKGEKEPTIIPKSKAKNQYVEETIKLPSDALINIMLEVGYPDFMSFCKVDKYLQKVCHNDYFWKQLYEKKYKNSNIDKYTKNYYEAFKLATQLTKLFKSNTIPKYLLKDLNNIETLYNAKKLMFTIILPPKEIGILANLTDLSINTYMLNSHISNDTLDEISHLKKLKTLKLINSHIGIIPASFSKLTNLTLLDLSNNDIEELPNSLFKLTNLKTLKLSKNKITVIPKNINNLKNLKKFDFKGNPIKKLPNEFYELLRDNDILVLKVV